MALTATGFIAPVAAVADGTPPWEQATTNSADAKPAKQVKKAKHGQKTLTTDSVDSKNQANSVNEDEDGSANINGLANLDDTDLQVTGQACNNFVPVNGVGGQVAGEELTGALGLLADGTGSDVANSKACAQTSRQVDDSGDASGGDDERNINGLVNVHDNDVLVPIQACNNFVPVNGVGGQVAGEEVAPALGVLASDTDVEGASSKKACGQGAVQDTDDDAGDGNTNGLVNVSDNDIHVPIQGCNNYVPVNGVGGQVTGEELTGALGIIGNGTGADADNDKSCAQASRQHGGENDSLVA